MLAWAPIPLATQEIAVTMGIERDAAVTALLAAGARGEAAGTDRFWSLAQRGRRAA